MGNKYIFRKATESDRGQVSELVSHLFSSLSKNNSDLIRALNHTLSMEYFYVLTEGETIIGAAQLSDRKSYKERITISDAVRYLGINKGFRFFHLIRNYDSAINNFDGAIISKIAFRPAFEKVEAVEKLISNILTKTKFDNYIVIMKDSHYSLLTINALINLGFVEASKLITESGLSYNKKTG